MLKSACMESPQGKRRSGARIAAASRPRAMRPSPPAPRPVSVSCRRGIYGLNFFMAAVQAGFGPFIAVVLTQHGWSQADIGAALSVGTIAAMASQLPAGALVDHLHSKRSAAAIGLVATAVSALMLASWPAEAPVMVAEAVHGFAACMLGPAVAALTLAVFGEAGFGAVLGQNARYASIGNAAASAAMGVCASYVSDRAVLWLAAALTLPALLMLAELGPEQHAPVDHDRSHPAMLPPQVRRSRAHRSWHVFGNPRLLIFAACAGLFFLGSAAMLPLAASRTTRELGAGAGLVIAALVIVPQAVVAWLSPAIGRLAERWGRLPVLLLGFAALPVRGLLFAGIANPYLLIPVQALDGISAAVFGVMVPLVAADLSRSNGYLNLSMGVINLGIGCGAALSTVLAGWIGDRLGPPVAFLALAAAGVAATLLLWLAMPETMPAAGRTPRSAAARA